MPPVPLTICASLALAAVTGFSLRAGAAGEPEEIRPPFGLHWQIARDDFHDYVKGTGVEVIGKAPRDGGGEVWTVTGFIQPDLARALMHFDTHGFLVEVELHYQNAAWDDGACRRRFEEMRRRFETRHGIGTLIAFEHKPDQGADTRLEGYQWVQAFAVLRLILFSASKDGEVYRNISLHCRLPPEEK